MQLEDYFEFPTTPAECIRIKDTRIDLDFVIELYKRPMTPEQIAVCFRCPLELVPVYAPRSPTSCKTKQPSTPTSNAERKLPRRTIKLISNKPPCEAVKRIGAIKATRQANTSGGVMKQVQFLLDENVPDWVQDAIIAVEPSIVVRKIGEHPSVPSKGYIGCGCCVIYGSRRIGDCHLRQEDHTTLRRRAFGQRLSYLGNLSVFPRESIIGRVHC